MQPPAAGLVTWMLTIPTASFCCDWRRDAYNTNGKLLLRLAQGWFNQPWGVAMAPVSFGAFSSMILVGNTGSGWIGAYSPSTGAFQGFLESGGSDITLPGLWGLEFGNGSTESGPANVLYFNAGGANLILQR